MSEENIREQIRQPALGLLRHRGGLDGSEGIFQVLKNEDHTGALPGRALKGPGAIR